MTENEDQPFKVLTMNHGKYIRLPETASGYYFRRVCHDGAITFLPVKMPKKELDRLEKIEKEGEFISLEETEKMLKGGL